MKAPPLTYHRAGSLAEALDLLGELGGMGKLMAGGQSLMPMLNLRLASCEHVVDIGGLSELRQSHAADGRRFIGAGVTHAMLEDGAVPDCARGLLAHVAAGIAYRSVRNRGTLGGSLAHADPAADWPCALRALDATVTIRGREGERGMPLSDFQQGLMETALREDEVLAAIAVPELSPGARWAYRKFCHKVGEFAHSICAVVHDPQASVCNVVLGAVGDKPVRLAGVSGALAAGLEAGELDGRAFTDLLRQDLTEAAELDPASYGYQLHKTIVTRSLAEALQK